MSMVNDYLMFRLLMEQNEKKGQRRQSMQYNMQQPRGSIFMPRASLTIADEPFCSPVVPHVPIR
ncbi:unnamed protein product, partial [Nippostrongylus brasiliensis]